MPAVEDALANHRRRIAGLCRWLTEAMGVTTPIVRIDTHLCTVLLAGDAAYKFKKPVAPGFVDFREVASREHFLREELRLNQRLAPHVYRSVRPVLGSDVEPWLGASDDAGVGAIDWALEMRRFDPALGFDALADRQALTPALIDELAERLARFHASLPVADAAFGRPETVWRWVADTLATLRQWARPADLPRVDALAQWSQQQAEHLHALLQARHAQGSVREGHGDLHLANIALIDGHPTPFDALEFSAELRCIDIVDDLAFPFMDLLAHGQPALAWRLVNRWVEITGEHDGLLLLRWFAVQRALVRAKVALLAAAEPGGDAATQPAHAARVARYLTTAEQLSAAPMPQLVVVWGLSGSGKSTVAHHLADALGAIRVRSDVERKRLHGLRADERPTDPAVLYSAKATGRTYERLSAIAATLLAGGVSVVVDAACLKRAEREALRAVAERHGARWHLLACEAPAEVLQARITQRAAAGADASDATLAVLALQQRWIEPVDADEQSPGTVDTLDTAVSPAVLAASCLHLAARWRAETTARAAG